MIKNIAFERKTALERRQELIEAGILCLGKGGMSAFTIDQICKQARVSRGLIHHHFDSKEDLLLCIYAQMTEYLLRDISDRSPFEQIASFIESSFDKNSFKKSSLRAWLAIWGEVATNSRMKALHQERYAKYKQQLMTALHRIASSTGLNLDAEYIARHLIALIDGLWLEYCLHSEGFSLSAAKADCYQFLQTQGVNIKTASQHHRGA
jgi:AcrR family transcriptional regulator